MGTNLKVGIVGLPNVGKSTFFNVLTKSSQAAAERWDWLVAHHKPASKVPAFLNVTDIAGLVKGASEGQGLGNAFLSHIRACDAMFHLCRTFEDPDITHVEGDVDPIRDLDIINEELRLKDVEYFEKIFDECERMYVRGGDKKRKAEYEILCKIKKVLIEEATMMTSSLPPSRPSRWTARLMPTPSGTPSLPSVSSSPPAKSTTPSRR